MSAQIYLVEFENPFPDAPEFVMGWLRDELSVEPEFLRLEIDAMSAFDRTRKQFNSTALLLGLREVLPDPTSKILGVTGVDLYIPVLTFVYGEAQLGGNAAVASSYRLRNSFYGLEPNHDITLTRFLKESLHELGHTMGLVHCEDYRCVMCASNSVEEIDLKLEAYCARCLPVVDRVIAGES
jgi:archaemetzincin